jgi:hypothetical protein
MVTAKDFGLIECQVALFTPALRFLPNKVLVALLEEWGEVFNGDPIVIPASPNLPPGVPRLTLMSKDSRYRIQASAARVDLFRIKDGELCLPEHLDWTLGVLFRYLGVTNASVNRVAAVLKRAAPLEDPAKQLASHFCREKWLHGPLNRPQEFELHAHKVFKLPNSVAINSWFRCKTVTLVGPPEQRAALVEQDFNTLAQDAADGEFSGAEIREFFALAPPEFDKVLSMYFPEESDV